MARKFKTVRIIDGIEYFWFNWCTGYYTREFCKNKIKELIQSGKYPDARIGSSIKDNYDNKRYYRIQVLTPKG